MTPTRGVVRRAVVRRFGAFSDLASPAGRVVRACLIVSNDFGSERETSTKELYWTPALLAAQCRRPFDRIVVCTESRQAALTLVERAARHVPDVVTHLVEPGEAMTVTPVRQSETPTLAVLQGHSAQTIAVAKSLLPGFAPQRTVLAFIDAPVELEHLGMLLLHERADVITTTTVGAPIEVVGYLTRTLGLKTPPASTLAPFVSSSTGFAASTAERADAWGRLSSSTAATDEFFFTAG